MGFGNNNNAVFCNISNGKICRQFKEKTKNSIERVNKKGVTVYEEFYDHVSGIITGIEVRDTEWGRKWDITLHDDDGVNIKLQMDYSSGYSTAFLKILPNVDLSKPVTIIPKMTVEGDKKKASLFITQGGSPLKHYYTKDTPHGLPQMTKTVETKGKDKGKTKWDDSDMMEFLENMVTTEILPKLKGEAVEAEEKEKEDLF